MIPNDEDILDIVAIHQDIIFSLKNLGLFIWDVSQILMLLQEDNDLSEVVPPNFERDSISLESFDLCSLAVYQDSLLVTGCSDGVVRIWDQDESYDLIEELSIVHPRKSSEDPLISTFVKEKRDVKEEEEGFFDMMKRMVEEGIGLDDDEKKEGVKMKRDNLKTKQFFQDAQENSSRENNQQNLKVQSIVIHEDLLAIGLEDYRIFICTLHSSFRFAQQTLSQISLSFPSHLSNLSFTGNGYNLVGVSLERKKLLCWDCSEINQDEEDERGELLIAPFKASVTLSVDDLVGCCVCNDRILSLTQHGILRTWESME